MGWAGGGFVSHRYPVWSGRTVNSQWCLGAASELWELRGGLDLPRDGGGPRGRWAVPAPRTAGTASEGHGRAWAGTPAPQGREDRPASWTGLVVTRDPEDGTGRNLLLDFFKLV